MSPFNGDRENSGPRSSRKDSFDTVKNRDRHDSQSWSGDYCNQREAQDNRVTVLTDVLPASKDRRTEPLKQERQRLSFSATDFGFSPEIRRRNEGSAAEPSSGRGRVPKESYAVARNCLAAAVEKRPNADSQVAVSSEQDIDNLPPERKRQKTSPKAEREEWRATALNSRKIVKESDSASERSTSSWPTHTARTCGRRTFGEAAARKEHREDVDDKPKRTLFVNCSSLASLLTQTSKSRERLDKAEWERAENALKNLEKKLTMSNIAPPKES